MGLLYDTAIEFFGGYRSVICTAGTTFLENTGMEYYSTVLSFFGEYSSITGKVI
jgi:hypothetical protein